MFSLGSALRETMVSSEIREKGQWLRFLVENVDASIEFKIISIGVNKVNLSDVNGCYKKIRFEKETSFHCIY